CIAISIAFFGGRPGMISSTAGAMAVLMVTLVKDHGLQYLLAASVLTGVLQYIAGHMRFSFLLRFVSRSVTTGFVNALAILIFLAQLPAFQDAGIQMYMMVGFGLFIIYLFPKITQVIPSTLVSIIILTAVTLVMDLDLKTIGDMGELPSMLPVLMIPDIPFNLETLKIIFPYSATLAVVGLLETLMTSVIIDDLTDTDSDKNRECRGQGIANIIAGFFGGMAGCALIGQSIINVESGGRSRLSALFAGCFLIFLILAANDFVKQIPVAALVAIMIMVSISTFNWSSIKDFRSTPITSNLVTFVTVLVVVVTHDLAQGVFVGVLLSVMFFAYKVSHSFTVEHCLLECGTKRVYKIIGQVFFASADSFVSIFNYKENISIVVIDLSDAHFWDVSAVDALNKISDKLKKNGIKVEIIGLNAASATIISKVLGQKVENS
ncbi:MAG: SulP family inorganic anion transporter, partial [Pseudomonadota bacterium]